MKNKTKAEDPNKLGVVKFLTWSARDVSLSANVIVLGFLTIYCTNYLNMNALVVGTLLMASKIVDAFTDIFGGFLIDRTNTRWGKGRPYEFAILGVWFCTWLLFSAPAEASGAVKCVWIFVMYMFVNSIFTTLLNASGNAYMVRAFGTDAQRVKLASYGGIAIMIGAILVNMLFPVAMAAIATTAAGWSRLVALFAVPLGLIGILRFFFVKETVKVDTVSEKVKIKDVLTILKENKYVYTVLVVQFVYAFVTGTGVSTYYYTYIVKNVSIMGFVSASSVIVLPVMIFFPAMLKKMYKSTLMLIGCLCYAAGSLVVFFAGGNIPILVIATIIIGLGTLPLTYLINLLALDCGTYNAYKGHQRMDGTIGAIKGYANKLGAAFGSGALGVLLSVGGFDASLETQSFTAELAITGLYALIPCILFLLVAILLKFYKLDAMMPEINAVIEEKSAQLETAADTQ